VDRRDIVVIGASAGGFAAIKALAAPLPSDFPAALFLVTHLPRGPSRLAQILGRSCSLEVRFAEDGDPIRPGTLLIAPPDRHLLLQQGRVMLSRGPRENLWRPAIDVLFRSAAVTFTSRTIGIVLSGVLDDGASGLRAIHHCGGIAIAQDPADAAYPGMPEAALHAVPEARRLACAEIAAALTELVRQPAPPPPPIPEQILLEARLAAGDTEATREIEARGMGTNLSCPECGGPLNLQPGDQLRFRCRLGHAYAAASLSAASRDAVESSLWVAIRLLEQRANIDNARSEAEREQGRGGSAERYASQAADVAGHANVLREMLAKLPG
jgi:two-component system chemotaxis response regulator CheB